MAALRGVTGSYYPPTVVKVYDPNNPSVAAQLNAAFPMFFAPASPSKAKEVIGAYSSSFHSTSERQIAQQLIEEGRLSPSAIEEEGLPLGFGELVKFVKALAKGGFTTKSKPPEVEIKHKGTTPTGAAQRSAGESGEKEASEIGSGILSGLGGILTAAGLKIVLALAGLALVVYGVMVAVRPRETALTLPIK